MDFNVLLAAEAQNGGTSIKMWGIMAFIWAFLYFIMIRPQKKRQAEHKRVVASLKKDDEVILDGGIYGSIHAVDEGFFQVKIAEKTIVKIDQGAVKAVLGAESAVTEEKKK